MVLEKAFSSIRRITVPPPFAKPQKKWSPTGEPVVPDNHTRLRQSVLK